MSVRPDIGESFGKAQLLNGAKPSNVSDLVTPVSQIITVDITRSLRDRGREKGEDRAAISYTKVDPGAPRTGRSRWT